MIYSEHLIKEITAELEKTPIVRHACSKFGIDHSTFYRWMVKHPTFGKEVTAALFFGRHRVNDAAESVIISGIQNKSFRAASFWLTHNDYRYMSSEKGKYHQSLNENMIKILSSDLPKDYPPTFEDVFKMFYWYEMNYEPEVTERIIEPIVNLICHEYPNLIDIFYASYKEWKNNLIAIKQKAEEAGIEIPEEDKWLPTRGS